jgi:hypothetical protein
MNDLPEIINDRFVHVLFADDTSILFSHSNFRSFEENLNNVLETVSSSFKRNLFALNCGGGEHALYPFFNKEQYSYLFANPHIPVQNS